MRGADLLLDTWDRARLLAARRRGWTALAALVVVLVVGAVAFSGGSRDEPGDAVVRGELTALAQEVREDPDVAARALPEGVVRRLEGVGEGALEGTLAKASSTGRCYALSLRVEASYVLAGDLEGLEVGAVREVPPEACIPSGDDPVSGNEGD